MAASLRISLNNMENGDISSGVLSSKERDLKRQMEKLHRCYMKKKEWKDSMRVVQQSMSREKKMLMEADKEPGSLRSCLDRLQSCIKVVSQQTLLERLETTSRLVDLSFSPPTGTENSAIISSEMFRIEIIFDPGGLVKDVRISHQGEPTSCDEITEVLRQGNFDEFIVHLKGLQSIYNISGDRKQKSKAYLALQALETDLNSLAQLQSSIKGVSNCIHKSPLGILLPRKGGCPMKLVYFVSPYDLLNKRTRSPHPMTVEAITEHGLGQSVTVCIEPHSHRRLQTIPLMSVVPQDGKSLPSFQALSQVNSTSLPACFTLMLARPIPVAMSVIHAIQEVTDIDVITEGEPESLLKLILAQSSGGKLSPGSEFFVTLPDQQHAYYLRDIGESSLDQTAKMVSRIPFTHPTNVANILNLLRQQLLFNTVISSCIRPYAKQDLMSSVVFELVCTSLQQFTIMFEHPLQDTMVTAEVDLTDITGVKFKVSIGEDGEDLLSDDAASKIFQRCWSVPVTLRSIIHKVSEQLRKEPSPEPVAMEIEQPPFVMPQEVTFATPYLPAMDSKSISSPGNMVLPNAKIPQGYGGIPPNTTQGAMLPPPIVEDSKKLDDDVPSSNPLLVTLLDQDSPDPDPPSVPESPMLSRLLEDSPSNNNTNSSLNNNNNVANLASSVPAPLKPGRGRPPKRKSVTDPPKGKSPKHRLTDNEYQSQSLSFESLTSSFDSDFQNASMDSQRFPHFSLSSPIDLTDDSVNPLRGLENTLDSIQSKQSMHHSGDPLANLTSELDSIQDVSIFSQTNSVPKNMARSTSLEGILNRSGEVSRTKDLHKPHHLQDSVPTNQARKTLVRQNSVGKVAQYQHQISMDSNDSFKAGSNLSFSRSTSFTHGNTSDSDTSLYSTRSFDLSDSFNNLSPVSNSSISRHDIGGDLTTEFKPELKLGHKDLRSLLMSSPNENSLLQSEKLKIKNAKGKMRMKLSGIKNSDLLGINRKKSSAEAYDFNSDEEDSNDLSMITASPTGLQLFNKSKTAKHLLNKIGKGDKLKKKEAKSTEPGKRKRDKKEKEHKKKKRLDSNSRATSCEMYSATPVESEDKTSTKLKIIKSVGVSMENSPRSSPSGREKGDGTRKSSINSQKSLKNSHKSLSMTSVNVSKEDSKLMTKTPKIKLKPIAIPPSSAVSNAKTPTPTSSPGSATPTSTTIGRIGAVSILTSGNSKAGGTTPSPGKVSTPTSAKTPPTFGGSKSFPSNKSVASSSTSLKAASAERKLSQSGRLSSGISKSSNGKYSSDRKSGSPSVSGSKSGLNSSKSLNSSSKGQSSNSFSKNSNNPLNSVLSFLNPKDKGLSSLPRIPKISSASSSNNNTKPTVSVTSTSVSTTTSVSTSIAGMSKLTTVNSHSNTKVSVSNNPHQGGVRNSPNTPGTPKNFPANSKNSANLNSKSTLVNSPNVRGSQMGSRSPSVNAANNKSPSSSNGKSPLSHTSNKLGINGRPPSNSNPPKTPVGSNTAHPLKTPTPGSGHNNGSPNINKPIPISTPPPTTTINKSNPQTSSPSGYPPKATPTGDQSPSVSNLSRNSPLLSQGPPGKTPNLVSKVSESPKSISVTTASKVTSPIMVSTDTPPKTTTPGSMVSPTTSCPSSNAKMRPRKSSLSAVIDKLTNAKVPHGVGGETNRQNSLDEGGEQAKAKTENALDGLDKASNGLERQSVSEPKKADSSDKNVPSKDSPSGIDKNKDLKIVDNSRNLFASLLKSASENFTSKHDKDDKENVSKSETGGKPGDSSEDVDSKAKDLSMQSVCKKSPKVIPKVNGETNVTVDNSIRKGEGDVFKVPTPKSVVSVDENDCEDIENMSVRRKARISTTKPVLSPASSGGSPENLIIDCQSPRQHGKNNSLNSPKCIVDLNDENKKLSPVTVVNNRQKTHTPSPKPKHSPNPSPKSVQHSSPAGMLEIDDDLMNEAIMGFTS